MTLYHNIFAWIHWDPPRFAFTIPFIERPVAWYGIFFASGFFLGFLLIIQIFKDRLLRQKQIFERDIANWPRLVKLLKAGYVKSEKPFTRIFSMLNTDSRKGIKDFQLGQEPDASLKRDILHALSQSMTDSRTGLDRSTLEKLFPKALNTVKELAVFLTDRMFWFVLAATIIGGRLGHVFFYDWSRYQSHPLEILKTWEGGLASHGGTIAIMLALFFYLRNIKKRFPEFTFVDLLDILCIPVAIAAVWIRIGNFFNQEITGPVTSVPWAVIFQRPFDGAAPLPRHPAQLYEAFAYLLTFFFLYGLFKWKGTLKKGTYIGLFMLTVFGSRFFIEFFKSPQSNMIDESMLTTGQYLSIPFILLGFYFLSYRDPKLSFKGKFSLSPFFSR